MVRRTLISTCIILVLLFTGCSQRYSRSFDPSVPDHSISGNLYENATYGFILIAPNSAWHYAGVPSLPLLVRSGTVPVARFTQSITPTISASLEVNIWDISGVVTPGMFTADIASMNAALIAADTMTFPSYNALSAVTPDQFNSIYAYQHEFTAYVTNNAGTIVQNRYRCVSFRERGNDYDRLFVIIGGTAASDWGSRSSEITSYITSFHYN